MFCNRCGRGNNYNNRFCVGCGNPLYYQNVQQKKNDSGCLLSIIIVFCVIFGIAIFLFFIFMLLIFVAAFMIAMFDSTESEEYNALESSWVCSLNSSTNEKYNFELADDYTFTWESTIDSDKNYIKGDYTYNHSANIDSLDDTKRYNVTLYETERNINGEISNEKKIVKYSFSISELNNEKTLVMKNDSDNLTYYCTEK